MGFKNVLKAELYKLTKASSMVKMLVASLIIFIAFSLLYAFIFNLGELVALTGVDIEDVETESATIGKIDEQTVKEAETAYEIYTKSLAEQKANLQLKDTYSYQLKANAVALRYMYENNLDYNSVTIFGDALTPSANAFAKNMISTMSTVIIIYAMVTVIKLVAGERNNGALKMQLLRPISKDAMLFAKLMATLIVSFVLFIFYSVLAVVVGIIAFNFDPKTVLVIFSASSAHEISALAEIAIHFIYYCTSIFAYSVIALFFATLIKKNSGMSIAFTIVLLLIGGSIESLLGYAFIGYAGFVLNEKWINTLTITGPAMNYMSFYSMVGITIAWLIAMLTSSVYLFRHTEVHN
ncbi:MAG: ABC transporter permease [Clostridia bacterium]|nr:ABC transporter permease [Clostridia bacterium]